MHVTKRVGYALRFLAELAMRPNRASSTVHEIARRHGLSEKYLWLAASALQKAGMVVAARGPSGGFRLAHPPSDITLADVIEACDGPWSDWLDGLDPANDPAFNAVLRDIGQRLAASWAVELRGVTLAGLMNDYHARCSELVQDFQI